MTDRTLFDTQLGIEHGRLQGAVGYDAPEGDALFVLGSDRIGMLGAFAPGDASEVYQTGSFANANVVRLRARTRGALLVPDGDLAWFAQVRIDDVTRAEFVIEPRRTRTLTDIAIPVATLDSVHKLGFRLVLRGATVPTEDVELPAFYVDALVLDGAFTRPQISNRNPEPNETKVPVDSTIALDIFDPAQALDVARTRVFVDGVLAFDGGAVEPSYDGPRSSAGAVGEAYRIELDPVEGLESQSTVLVNVESAVTGGAIVQWSYAFDVEDATPPRLVVATASAADKIRISFNEPMDPAGIRVEAFTVARSQGEIAVNVSPVEVRSLSDIEVEITLDQEMSSGATYTVTASGISDRTGNPVESPYDTIDVIGFTFPAPADRVWNYFDLQALINRDEDEAGGGDLRRFLAIIQQIGDRTIASIDAYTDIIDPDVAPIAFVDAMLDDLGNPFVSETMRLSEVERRKLVQALVPLYKQVGTAPGIIAAVRFFLGIEVEIESTATAPLGLGDWELGETWILGTSDPIEQLTFRVLVPRLITDVERSRMALIVEAMKAEREFFKIIEPTVEAPTAMLDHLELGLSELGVSWTLH